MLLAALELHQTLTTPTISCTKLPSFAYAPFSAFTTPLTNTLLKANPHLFAIGATMNKKPAGLLVAKNSIVKTESIIHIESVFVGTAYRRLGIGSALLEAIESHASQQQAKLTTTLIEDSNGTPAMNALLDAHNWGTPKLSTIICKADASFFVDLPLLNNHIFHFNSPLETFSWSKRTEKDEATLKELIIEHSIPQGLRPDSDEHLTIHQNVSVGVRENGELVGWMIVHTINATTLRHSSLWIAPHLIGKGHGIILSAEAIRNQEKVVDTFPNSIFIFDCKNEAMRRFVNRRLLPSIASISSIFKRDKDLTSGTQ